MATINAFDHEDITSYGIFIGGLFDSSGILSKMAYKKGLHEKMTMAAAKKLGVKYDQALEEGCAWPDAPHPEDNLIFTNYEALIFVFAAKTTKDLPEVAAQWMDDVAKQSAKKIMDLTGSIANTVQDAWDSSVSAVGEFFSSLWSFQPDESLRTMPYGLSSNPDRTKDLLSPECRVLAYESHFGSLQFMHSMSPSDKLSNGAILNLMFDQAKTWWEKARKNRGDRDRASGSADRGLFHVGKLIHMVQDSFCDSHTKRKSDSKIKYFQSYQAQDSGKHKKADVKYKSYPKPTAAATEKLLEYYKQDKDTATVMKYLSSIWEMDSSDQKKRSGGSEKAYRK